MANYVISILLLVFVSATLAQYDSPAPSRINIPGAVPIPFVRGINGGRQQLQPAPGPGIRIRRPGARLQQAPQAPIQISTPRFEQTEVAKPVLEDTEDDLPQPFIPQLLAQAQPQLQHPNQQQNSQEEEDDEDSLQQNIVARFNNQEQRPVAVQRSQIPERFFSTDKEVSTNAQRFALTSEKPQARQQQYRPAPQQQQPQARQQSFQRPQQQQQQQYDEPRPQQKKANDDRNKKPVAQILRKYREESEDGTITWGFENDDGSFKEEVIGIDCVTRGRYGYIDPEGVKREYNYETGILCDPNNKEQEEDDDEPIVDYQENKAILPNGVRIDMSKLGKNKSNRPQPQQFYRN